MAINFLNFQNKVAFGNKSFVNPYNQDGKSDIEIGKTFFRDASEGCFSEVGFLRDMGNPEEECEELWLKGVTLAKIACTDEEKENKIKKLVGEKIRTYA